MRRSESWAKAQTNSNITTRVGDLRVMAHFGSSAPPAAKVRKKSKDADRFVVGESEVGGEEVV